MLLQFSSLSILAQIVLDWINDIPRSTDNGKNLAVKLLTCWIFSSSPSPSR